ncbi:MAG: tRNA pseudouridine(38-40) synthase TruA [Firmicutes bacterium]|nr:tRNA pseudouridine(38-40) synthase TruA [Bacillota bacterium]
MERNILLTIQYDGTCFSGWQRQPNARTVQGEIEAVLSKLCAMPMQIHGTSRTDAGVHALGQRASFKGEFGIPTDRIQRAANNMLAATIGTPRQCADVRIIKVEEMPENFHARFDCKGKTYRYVIKHGCEADVFQRNYTYQLKEKLDTEAMKAGAAYIVGTHDFACFQAAGGTPRETTVRTIFDLQILEQDENTIWIEVTGDGFLYNMVRIIVGTLVEIGQKKRSALSVAETIGSADRRTAGHTAPAEGLYLKEIYYDAEEMKKGR